jgi:hypothetical protein
MEYNKLFPLKNERFFYLSDLVLKNKDSFNILTFNIEKTSDALPCEVNLVNLMSLDCTVDYNLRTKIREFIENLKKDTDLLITVYAYYKPGSFISWHTNENVELYNAICTFSDIGDSYFEYKDQGKTVSLKDPVGWSVKKTKWGEKEKLWHRAYSNCNRITITLSHANETKIDSFIKELVD